MLDIDHAMQTMLQLCDKFADDFDIKFNSGKSVAMRIGKKYNEKCVSLQLDSKDITFVNELKYLGDFFCVAFEIEISSYV